MIKNDIFFLGSGFLSMIKISSNADFFETGFKVVLDRIGKLQNAAQIAGVTAEQVAKWRDGKAKPPFKAVVALANAADVSLDWLATGMEFSENALKIPDKKDSPFAVEAIENNREAMASRWRDLWIRSDLSQDEFAKSLEVAPSTFKNWISGRSCPTIDTLLYICEKHDVSFYWLATGTESPEKTSGKPDKKELLHAIETVEETLSSAKKNIEPLKKAELILAIYDLFTSESKPSPAQIVGILSKIL